MGDGVIQNIICWLIVSLLVSAETIHPKSIVPAFGDVNWLGGKELNKAVLVEIHGTWSDAPIRSLLLKLSRTKQIPLFIDRRVDPTIEVDLVADGINWEQLLVRIGREQGFGFCRLDDIYYFGPADIAVVLPGQYGRMKDWLAENRNRSQLNWRQKTSLKWNRLSQPKQILDQLSIDYNIQVQERQIPLDLWPSSDLPDVSLLLKTALLSVGFDQWFMLSRTGTKLKFIPFPSPESVEYKLNHFQDAKQVARDIGGQFEMVESRSSGKTLTLKGRPVEVQTALRAAIEYQQVVKGGTGTESTFTLDFKGKRGSALATMAQQLSLRLSYERNEVETLNEHIEFETVNETSAEIIARALKGTGLQHRIENGELKIVRD